MNRSIYSNLSSDGEVDSTNPSVGTDSTVSSVGVTTDGVTTASTIEAETLSVVDNLLYKSLNNCVSGTGDLTAFMMAQARPSLRTTAAPPSPMMMMMMFS
jgi:uncharacterized protein YaiE (UPF0345 family)